MRTGQIAVFLTALTVINIMLGWLIHDGVTRWRRRRLQTDDLDSWLKRLPKPPRVVVPTSNRSSWARTPTPRQDNRTGWFWGPVHGPKTPQ